MGVVGPPADPRSVIAGWVAVACVAVVLLGARTGGLEWLAELARPRRFQVTVGGAGLAALLGGVLATLPGLSDGPPSLVRRGLAFLWLGVPLPLLYLVRLDLGVAGLASLLVLSKVGDVAGYYAGSLLGERFPHHPFPVVSPGKTAVGCWASLVAATAAGGAVQALGLLPEARLGLLSGLVAGALVNVGAQAGDLLESRVKRGAGVKDSGRTFGPSGGTLDVVDSLLLSVPTALLTWPLLFHWPYPA